MSKGVQLFLRICSQENLYAAWQKAKYVYENESDFVIQRDRLSEYEANLSGNLATLSESIKSGKYQLHPIIPMPLPKSPKDGKGRNRQHFYIDLEDQIVWIAVINIIGPILDNNMPYWSFGNRLYMPIWREDIDNGKQATRFGTYRSSSRKIYRTWSSSWPLFRKAVSITVKKMGKHGMITSEEAQEETEYNAYAPAPLRITYWDNDFWRTVPKSNIYYATTDLSLFYPSIDIKNIFSDEILSMLYPLTLFGEALEDVVFEDQGKLFALLKVLCEFVTDKNYQECDDDGCLPDKDGVLCGKNYLGLPTGLFVAGFLANVAMLPIDQRVMEKINLKRNIAHFRFVDDHVFLATSVNDLVDWQSGYEKLIEEYLPRIVLNSEKTEPPAYREYLGEVKNEEFQSKAERDCLLDKHLPSPFTTLTIQKMSGLGRHAFEIFDEEEKLEFINDIEHLLVTEFPETEIRKETRVSWAASMLNRVISSVEFDTERSYLLNKSCESMYYKIDELQKKECSLPEKNIAIEIKRLNNSIERATSELEKTIEETGKLETQLHKRVFMLLLRALEGNISKPKIWRKAIGFCRATGYDGLSEIIEMACNDKTLTKEGRCYILATIASEISYNVVLAVSCFMSKMRFENERSRNHRFISFANKHSKQLKTLLKEQKAFYITEIMNQYSLALRLADCEINKKKYFSESLSREYAEKYLWYCTGNLVRAFSIMPPRSYRELVDTYMQTPEKVKANAFLRKFLRMYCSQLVAGEDDIVFEEDVQIKRRKLLQGKKKINLFLWIKKNITAEANYNNNNALMLNSEWTMLEITKKALKTIGPKVELNFWNPLLESDTITNCHPINYTMYFPHETPLENWRDLLVKFAKVKMFRNTTVFNEIRFDCRYYNEYGAETLEKRRVYSLGILLLCLAAKDFSFSPLINRGDSIEKRQHLLWEKFPKCQVSSFTRAIIIGALSSRHFEKQRLSYLDYPYNIKRDDDSLRDPVKIDTLREMEFYIDQAQKMLKNYQLSLENNTPRQIVPVALRSYNIANNPFEEN